MEWRLRRVVPAAVVTTHAKPHAQQQLARDLEEERAAMGQRFRPQSSGRGLLCAAARFGFAVLKNNLCLLYTSPSPRDGLLSRMPSSA